MTTSTRLTGAQGFYLGLKVGAGTLTVLGDDVKKWEIKSDDKDDDDLTFAEALAGLTAQYTLTLTSIVSFDSTSLWMFLYNNPGATVTITLAPKGNTVAAAGKPVFTLTGTIGAKPPFSNEAQFPTKAKGAEFEYDIAIVGDLSAAFS